MNVTDQIQPADTADYRERRHDPPKRRRRRAKRTLTRALLLAAVALIWVGIGVYGTVSYGVSYNTYRGFPPPVDPVGVVPGHVWHEKFYSKAFHQRRTFLVYTPPGYRRLVARGVRFPVLYMLHGAPGHPKAYINVAAAGVALDTLVNRHQIRPYILVMPNGSDGTFRSETEWADSPHGPYETLVLETMHATDHRFATLRGRQWRGLAGYSEGAYAAINISLHHLKTFSIAESWSGYGKEKPVGAFLGATPLQLWQNSPSLYAPTLARELRRFPLYAYVYGGSTDKRTAGQRHLALVLRLSGVHTVFRTFPGGHDWGVWRPQTPRMILWAGRMFGREVPRSPAGAVVPGPRAHGRRFPGRPGRVQSLSRSLAAQLAGGQP